MCLFDRAEERGKEVGAVQHVCVCVCVARRAVRIRQRDAEENGDSLPIPPLLPSHFCFSLSEGKEFWRCTTEFLCNLILGFFFFFFVLFPFSFLTGVYWASVKRGNERRRVVKIYYWILCWIFIHYPLSSSFSAKICWICFSVKRDISKKEKKKRLNSPQRCRAPARRPSLFCVPLSA